MNTFIAGLLKDERELGDVVVAAAPWADDDTSIYREANGYTVVRGEEYAGTGEALGSVGQWFIFEDDDEWDDSPETWLINDRVFNPRKPEIQRQFEAYPNPEKN